MKPARLCSTLCVSGTDIVRSKTRDRATRVQNYSPTVLFRQPKAKEGDPFETTIHRRVTLVGYAHKLVLSAPLAMVIENARIWTALSYVLERISGLPRARWDHGVMGIE